MNREQLEKVLELEQRITDVDNFIHRYCQTWKKGIIKRESRLVIGHHGYGFYQDGEMDCDKELSQMLYEVLILYQKKLHKEFEELGVNREL